ncbi:MAG: hypothetical protein L0Z51_10875, partial [Candidatus Latescibacteria bacterium]|nr:hypothetical protein [Candidatus Latescibacterota bacterium]
MLAGAGYDPGAIRRPLEISLKLGDTQFARSYAHVALRGALVDAWLADHGRAGEHAPVPDDRFRTFQAALHPPT